MMRGLMFVIVVMLITAGVSATVAAEDGFSIGLTPSVDTPDRTAEVDGDDFPISTIGRIEPGETVTAGITAPSDRSYQVVVYDSYDREKAEKQGHGDATVHFDTTGWSAGSYLVAVESAGNVVAIHPLVVSAYTLDVSSPNRAAPGSAVRVSADLESTGTSASATRVTALISGEGGEEYQILRSDDQGTYAGTISVASLPEGDYSVYVIVQGSKVHFNARETIALTDGLPLTIGAPTSTADEQDPTTTTEAAEQTADDVEPSTATEASDTGATEDESVAAAKTQAAEPTLEAAALTNPAIIPLIVAGLVLVLLLGYRLR